MKKTFFVICCIISCFLPSFAFAKILFIASIDGKFEIFMMGDDGGNVKRLTNNQHNEYSPRWSPDGKRIAFVRNMGTANKPQYDLFVMDVKGTYERRLTDHPAADGPQIAWAPDGKRIAFVSVRNPGVNIYIIDLESGAIKQLTNTILSADPDWSPDGRHIVFERSMQQKGRSIYTINADGMNEQPLVPNQARFFRYSPRWSPNSDAILYVETEFLHLNNIDDVAAKNLVIHREPDLKKKNVHPISRAYFVRKACWASDGREVLFSARKQGDPQNRLNIYRYNIASRQIRKLPNALGRNQNLADWIDDSALPVFPADKLALQWAELKQLD